MKTRKYTLRIEFATLINKDKECVRAFFKSQAADMSESVVCQAIDKSLVLDSNIEDDQNSNKISWRMNTTRTISRRELEDLFIKIKNRILDSFPADRLYGQGIFEIHVRKVVLDADSTHRGLSYDLAKQI